MSQKVLLGLLFGGGIGLANAGASFLLYHAARTRPAREFDRLVFGGLVARMVSVLVLVALVLWLSPVDVFAFLAALLGTFIGGLTLEIAYFLRRPVNPDK